MRKASFVISAKAEKKAILTELPLGRQPEENMEVDGDEIITDELNEISKGQSEEPKLNFMSESDNDTEEKIPSDSGDLKQVSSLDDAVKVDGPTDKKSATSTGSSKSKKQKSKEIKEVNQKEPTKSEDGPHLLSRNILIESEKVEEPQDLAEKNAETSLSEIIVEKCSEEEIEAVDSSDVLVNSEVPIEDGTPKRSMESDTDITASDSAEIEIVNEEDKLENDMIQNNENQDQVNEDIAKIKMFVGTAEFWDPFTSDYYPDEDSPINMDQEFFLEGQLFDFEKKKEKKKNALKYVESSSFGESIEEERGDIPKSGKKKNIEGFKNDHKMTPDVSLSEKPEIVPLAANADMLNILLELEEKIISLQDLLSDEKSRSSQLVEAFLKIEIEHEILRAEFLQYKIMALELSAGKDS